MMKFKFMKKFSKVLLLTLSFLTAGDGRNLRAVRMQREVNNARHRNSPKS